MRGNVEDFLIKHGGTYAYRWAFKYQINFEKIIFL